MWRGPPGCCRRLEHNFTRHVISTAPILIHSNTFTSHPVSLAHTDECSTTRQTPGSTNSSAIVSSVAQLFPHRLSSLVLKAAATQFCVDRARWRTSVLKTIVVSGYIEYINFG